MLLWERVLLRKKSRLSLANSIKMAESIDVVKGARERILAKYAAVRHR